MIGTYYFWVCCMGMGARSVVNFSRGNLCVWRSPLHYLGYTLEWSLVLEHVCAGGGNVTFHGIYICFPRKSFIIGVSYAPMGHLRMWHVQLS